MLELGLVRQPHETTTEERERPREREEKNETRATVTLNQITPHSNTDVHFFSEGELELRGLAVWVDGWSDTFLVNDSSSM